MSGCLSEVVLDRQGSRSLCFLTPTLDLRRRTWNTLNLESPLTGHTRRHVNFAGERCRTHRMRDPCDESHAATTRTALTCVVASPVAAKICRLLSAKNSTSTFPARPARRFPVACSPAVPTGTHSASIRPPCACFGADPKRDQRCAFSRTQSKSSTRARAYARVRSH